MIRSPASNKSSKNYADSFQGLSRTVLNFMLSLLTSTKLQSFSDNSFYSRLEKSNFEEQIQTYLTNLFSLLEPTFLLLLLK